MSTAIAGRPKPTASVRAAILGPTPRNDVRPSIVSGTWPPCSSTIRAGERQDVARLGLGEAAPPGAARQARARPASTICSGRPGLGEQAEADRHRRLVAGPGRDQAADELFERRAEPSVAQVEHRRLGQTCHGLAEPTEHLVDVEGLLGLDVRDDSRGTLARSPPSATQGRYPKNTHDRCRNHTRSQSLSRLLLPSIMGVPCEDQSVSFFRFTTWIRDGCRCLS